MGKRITWRANVLICLIIVLGFVLTSYISYHSNRETFERDAQQVSVLTSESIAREIDAQFTRPVNVSLTMANDSLLKEYLDGELERLDDPSYEASLTGYLEAYRAKYGYDSVFLASAATTRYYHYNGVNRTLETGDPENDWFYAFLDGEDEYALNVDNDEATDNAITVFVNCRILDEDGGTLGIVGVGFRIDDLRALFASYEQQTETRAYLVDGAGTIEVSTDGRDEGAVDLFEADGLEALRDESLVRDDDLFRTWYNEAGSSGYLVAQYVPYLDWFLVVDHDTSALDAQIARQFALALLVIAAVIALVLAATTSVFRRYNTMIIEQTAATEQKHRSIFQEAAEQLYDDIYEIDVTHNRAASESTEAYFESLGAPRNVPFDEAIAVVAERQIALEHRQAYLDTFKPEAVLESYRRGVENLTFEFKMTEDGASYHWIRIYAHLFVWDEDGSVRMLVYRQNIDDEKRRERTMFEQMQRDSLTGLFNKAATQSHISDLLSDAPDMSFAFFILDIDDFKGANDQLGHGAGDAVLARFASAMRAQFRPYDVVGRIGGDEFVAFAPLPDEAAAAAKAGELVKALSMTVLTDAGPCTVSTSAGVAFGQGARTDFETLYRHADQALYRAKADGKNRFALYEEGSSGASSEEAPTSS